MLEAEGDIWKLSGAKDAIVIPTNIGWRDRDGRAVMGAGLARDAARRFPALAVMYGKECQEQRERTPITVYRMNSAWCLALVLFPVKPLLQGKPYLSWQQPASVELIKAHLPALEAIGSWPELQEGKIYVPSLGCGNGQLDEEDVLPLLQKLPDRFVHVTFTGERKPWTRSKHRSQ